MTLNMNSGMKGDVGGAGFRSSRVLGPPGISVPTAPTRRLHLRCAAYRVPQFTKHLVPMRLQGTGLPGRERSGICSESGIKHGFGGDRRCSRCGFLMTCAQPGWRRS